MSSAVEVIDETLYSRQLYVMGHVAQKRMASSSVLLCGLGGGLGVETAKNLILAGVKSVSLYDSQSASYTDLAANFYLSQENIGSNRATICAEKLAELNPYVSVSAIDPVFKSLADWTLYITAHTITVLVLSNYTDVLEDSGVSTEELCDWCHENGVCVVVGEVQGVFARIFTDFGDSFVCNDKTGEQPATSMVAGITCTAHESEIDTLTLTVTVLEDTRHNLEGGDTVSISEIDGMAELELQGREAEVRVKDPFSFEIDIKTKLPAASVSPYARGGYIKQIVKPVTVSFRRLSESTKEPFVAGGTLGGDVVKMDAFGPLHLGFAALHAFRRDKGQFPAPGNAEEAEEVFQRAFALQQTPLGNAAGVSERDLMDKQAMVQRLAMCCQGRISPVCALIGGIMGQEVLKACSGKFMPLTQWFYYHNMEALPSEPLPAAEVTPVGSRYDGNIIVFGQTMQKKLHSLSMFLVGAGAIGCEMLKNWAMMGIACGEDGGTIYITDMDHIEKSNLSRQFLFRNADINCPKSTTAATAIKQNMNPSLKIVSYESKVASDTETLFNDAFFESLDMVCTALDNVEARLYIDQRCMFYHKPMLESGTLGAKGHTQVVVPFKTENYGATRDPPEKSIPVCTLKHFPNQIDHTLQWGREWFEEIFKQTPEDVNQCLQSASIDAYKTCLASQQNMKMDTLNRVCSALLLPVKPLSTRESVEATKSFDFTSGERPKTFVDCMIWARHRFEDLFSSQIKQLLYNFPLDRRIADSGALFWSGAKKPPSSLTFDSQDALHREFVFACAAMRAHVYGIEAVDGLSASSSSSTTVHHDGAVFATCDTVEFITSVVSTVEVMNFKPAEGVKIAATDEEAKQQQSDRVTGCDIDEQCDRAIKALSPFVSWSSASSFLMRPAEFDKDNDMHMRVVAAVSNLRARNYKIPEADLHTSRGIAGKITPAIATTTALVTGAICLELYKIVQDKPQDQLQNSFINLALPLFTSVEPDPPKNTISMIKGKEWKWSPWDRIDLVDDPNQPMTVDGLIAYLDEEYGLELSMLSTGVTILYSDFMDRKKMRDRKVMPLKQVVETVSKKTIPADQMYLIFEIIVNDADSGDEVDAPYMRFKLF